MLSLALTNVYHLPPAILPLQVSLFLANLKGDINNDEKLLEEMKQYGTVERCFILRNPNGDSKVSGARGGALLNCPCFCHTQQLRCT